MKRNIWLDGIMGVVVGDALGCPVQFMSREEIASRDEMPKEWLSVIKRREWIEELCHKSRNLVQE